MNHHPSAWLSEKVTSPIREWATIAEFDNALHQQQLHSIYENKWFKLFVPETYGGLELSIPEALKIEEALSWADGSTAWVVTLCAGAGWFAGFINPHVLVELCNDEKFCIAGSGALSGCAELINNGYLVNGTWPYASGASHATAFTMNCLLKKDNEQLYNIDGSPQIATLILKRKEVAIKQNWKAMGMRATGSHSFEVKGLSVPFERSFVIDPAHAMSNNPLYRYPFLQFAEITLAINISGMACRFIDLAEEILRTRSTKEQSGSDRSRDVVNNVKTKLNQSRTTFYDIVLRSWEAIITKRSISEVLLQQISDASQQLVKNAREGVNLLYPHCGLKAAQTDTEINRVWRNIHTAAQHALFIA